MVFFFFINILAYFMRLEGWVSTPDEDILQITICMWIKYLNTHSIQGSSQYNKRNQASNPFYPNIDTDLLLSSIGL